MAEKRGSKSLFHIGIWLSEAELDAAMAFYKDLLDFEPVARSPRRSGGERVFMRNSAGNFLELLVGDDVQHLMHFPQHPKERVVGLPHLCFEIPDLDAARAVVDAHGFEVVAQGPADGSFGSSEAGVHRILFVKGPGGTTLELFEFREKGVIFDDQ